MKFGTNPVSDSIIVKHMTYIISFSHKYYEFLYHGEKLLISLMYLLFRLFVFVVVFANKNIKSCGEFSPQTFLQNVCS